MAKSTFLSMASLFYILLFIHNHLAICLASSLLPLNSSGNNEIDLTATRNCSTQMKMGECVEEAEMESEISRRVLNMQKKYISYETLRRDMVPCDRPGASYYSCHARQANPFSRGCEVITRCARGIRDIKT